MVSDPIRLDHMQRTVRDVFVDALSGTVPADQIVWMEQDIPRQKRPLVALQVVSGPTVSGRMRLEQRFRLVNDSADVVVGSALANTRYRLRLNGIALDYTTGPAPTISEIRDALRQLVNRGRLPPTIPTKQLEPVTAADGVGAGDLTLTPTLPGGLLGVEVFPASAISVTVNESTTDCVIDTVGQASLGVQVDVYTVGGQPISQTSRMLALRLLTALDTPEGMAIQQNARVFARRNIGIADLTGLEPGGARMESRSQFEIAVTGSLIVSSTIQPIESIEYTADIGGTVETQTLPTP